jgi:hypothetical protein
MFSIPVLFEIPGNAELTLKTISVVYNSQGKKGSIHFSKLLNIKICSEK